MKKLFILFTLTLSLNTFAEQSIHEDCAALSGDTRDVKVVDTTKEVKDSDKVKTTQK
ncbi:MAG: hypothetical protein N4A33_10040 [Bacteriovoracaceae bacterium]|jgi:hypothetical protein|nr:hypothetical protein [Bacteriovoracaceae bacterium]